MIIEKQELFHKTAFVVSRETLRVLLLTAVITGLFLIIILIASLILDLPVGTFTRDPLQVVDAPFYTGIVSNIGILFWCSTVVICLFSFVIIHKSNNKANFLLLSGIFSLLLLLDDFFLFHEVVYRNYLHIPQKVVFLFYILSVIYILFRFRQIILQTEFIFLITSILFFTLSGIVDALPKNILPVHHLFEDGFKFIGIVFWFVYFSRTSYFILRSENEEVL